MMRESKVNESGEVVIPEHIRCSLNIEKGDLLRWSIHDGDIVVEVVK